MFKTFSLACISAVALGLKVSTEHDGDQSVHIPELKYPHGERPHQEMEMAQTGSMASNLTCQYGENRNKAPVDDFWSILAGTAKYSDDDFTPDNTSLAWATLGETTNLSVSHWRRAKEVFPNQTLFGDGISFDDVRQGSIGNCWFLAAASGLSEVPGRMEKVFLNTDNALNNNGIYAVNFYTLGMPHTVVVDDYLPLKQYSDGSYGTLYSKIGRDNSLWSAILEKAFAKYHGNYEHIVGGWPGTATRTLNGGPYQTFWHDEAAVTVDFLWNKMVEHDNSNHIMMAATPGSSDQTTNAEGLVNNHAYVVLGVKRLSNGVRLVKLRNPWGSEYWRGDWSDSSPLWTSALKAEAGMTVANDGVIWMTIEYYQANVEATDFILDTTNMHSASFLKLNDTNTGSTGGWWCTTAGCQVHILDIESTVAQDVWVTVHTWDDRMIASQCAEYTTRHVAYGDWDQYGRSFRYGAQELPVATFTAAGKKSLRVEMNFSNALKAKDWSVVAWGAKGPVAITHRRGFTSDQLPVAPARNTPGPTPGPTPPTPEPEPEPVDPCEADFEIWEDRVLSGCNEPTSQESSFLSAMTSYAITPNADNYCMRKSLEKSFTDDNGETGYQSYSELACDDENISVVVKVKMETQDWYDIEYVLPGTTDAVQECEEVGDLTTCWFRLGHYADWESRGMSGPWIKKIGWRCAGGDYGQYSGRTMTWQNN